ncbi:zinc metalloproteinase nas-14-like [Paramacrobiotus metropolitanus]|uniref:zinc metalloproteinase nas-14-like n=1 Tax=Paramacrobiotus metropolitanus TaxID=2943436 RepID=UPI00244614FF|nr:zinc metalloproteinase nas-14-like [Paramacrobiotus metropolitanus]
MRWTLAASFPCLMWITGAFCSPSDDQLLLLNDIIWDDEDSSGYRHFVSAMGYLSPDGYWPNNGQDIPYELRGFNDGERKIIEKEISSIEWRTTNCVTFKKRTTEQQFISIARINGFTAVCQSGIGRIDGRETRVRLHPDCLTPGIIQHEIMHALGFLHEHSRPDRDEHIRVIPSNMKPLVPAMDYQIMTRMATFGLPYDEESLMHYGLEVAADRYKPAFVSKAGTPSRWMGQRFGLSTLDVAKLKAAYNCSRKNVVQVPNRDVCVTGATNTANAENEDAAVNEYNPGTTFLYPVPSIDEQPFTPEQCERQFSSHCNVSWRHNVNDPNRCSTDHHSYAVVCHTGAATKEELLATFRRMSQPPARFAALHLHDSPHITAQTLQPLRFQILEFSMLFCHTNRMTGKLRGMALTNMIAFGADRCEQGLAIRSLDFSTSPKLRVVKFQRCVIQSVEVDSFSYLLDLRVMTLEFGASPVEIKKQHCDPCFAWYRQWLSRNRFLTQRRRWGSVYKTNREMNRGMWSQGFEPSDLYRADVTCD